MGSKIMYSAHLLEGWLEYIRIQRDSPHGQMRHATCRINRREQLHWGRPMAIRVRTKDVREAGERARARIAGEPRGPGWLGAVLIGIIGGVTGAFVAFLTDPQRGKARRAQLFDQGAATVRHAA